LSLRDASRRCLDSLLSLIEGFDREITVTTEEIEARGKAGDRVDVARQILTLRAPQDTLVHPARPNE
jgi:hypothetical protein